MAHLIIAEATDEGIRPAILNCLTAVNEAVAAGQSGEIHAFVGGQNCQATADALAALPNVTKVWVADHAGLANSLAESLTPIVVELAADYQSIWATADSFGKNLFPRVAALLDCQQISDITGVKGARSYERPIYAGNALATVESAEPKDIITVRATAFEASADQGGSGTITQWESVSEQALSRYEGAELSSSDRPELTSAKIVISGGRGMQDGANFAMLDTIADKLGAAVGASRAAVDAGFVPNDYQVGQTGKVVAPELYIAVGISGAIQHLAGMKDSKVIVAINKDDEAPIFQVADYGLVADLFTALPELDRELG